MDGLIDWLIYMGLLCVAIIVVMELAKKNIFFLIHAWLGVHDSYQIHKEFKAIQYYMRHIL